LPKNTKIKPRRTKILPGVLYGCENWSLTLKEEYGQRKFENRVQRKIYGVEGKKVRGSRRKFSDSLSRFIFVIKYYSGDEID
jgi:hypothetical protein